MPQSSGTTLPSLSRNKPFYPAKTGALRPRDALSNTSQIALSRFTYRTAWRYWTNGTLPVKAVQLSSGTILVEEETPGCEACHWGGALRAGLRKRIWRRN